MIFVFSEWGAEGVCQSGLHEAWTWRYTATMRADLSYSPTDCFETFPFPDPLPPGETAQAFHDLRAERTRARNEGLTKLYNRINDPEQDDDDLVELRRLMTQLDREVADAYGWRDLDLDHGFHQTRFGIRFTIGPDARREVLDRLLELNHLRYADELARGLHAPKGRAKRPATAAPTPSDPAATLFDDG